MVHDIEGISPGFYKNTHLIQAEAGNFREKTGYLCINQAIARDCAATLFFLSNYLSYQTAVQLAGFVEKSVYLFSNYWQIDSSGIGAF